jgi:ATP-dependent DNA ligase
MLAERGIDCLRRLEKNVGADEKYNDQLLYGERIFLAFDLIELNGDDLRRDPLEGRKATHWK